MADLRAPFAGTIVAVPVAENARVAAHAPVAIIEAMKMEHESSPSATRRSRALRSSSAMRSPRAS